MNETPHRERRAQPFTDEQLDALAERLSEKVAEKAYQKFTAYVGRSVVRNLIFIVLVSAAGLVAVWKWKTGSPS